MCDAALKFSYSLGEKTPQYSTVQHACNEVMSFQPSFQPPTATKPVVSANVSYLSAAVIGAILAVGSYVYVPDLLEPAIDKWGEAHYPPMSATVIEREVFPEQLTKQIHRATNFEQGVGDLYKVWGFQPSMLDKLCLQENEGAFICDRASGNIQALRVADVPVLLTLERDNVESFAVLYKLGDEKAQLLLADKNVEVPLNELEQLWNGEYHRISRRYWQQTMKFGMRGTAITLLDQKLSQVLGKPLATDDVYDLALKEKVMTFQRWQGLTADGIAGKNTLQRLAEVAPMDAPSLSMSEENI